MSESLDENLEQNLANEKKFNSLDKERRTVFLAGLTVFFLGFSNFLNTGKFLFTFPINDFILAVVAIYFFILNFKVAKINSLLLLAFSLANFVNNFYNLELFFNSEEMTKLAESLFPDLAFFMTLIVYFTLMIRFVFKDKSLVSYIFLALTVIFVVLTQFEALFYLYYFCFLTLPLMLFFRKEKDSKQYKSVYYFFLLFALLNGTKLFTLYFS